MTKVLDSVPIHSSRRFAWYGRRAVGEISDFGQFFMGRLYNDSCDIGFRIVSSITGKTVTFYLSGECMRDGGVESWEFSCLEDKTLSATIFND